MIRRFTAEGHRFRLIVSLGAPTSEERLPLMPIERRWPLPELMEAIRAYAATLSGRVTLAYVGIGGREPEPRARPAAGGAGAGAAGEDQPDRRQRRERARTSRRREEEVAAFRDELSRAGIPVVRRYSGGREIGAACGTLSASQRGGELVPLPADIAPAMRRLMHAGALYARLAMGRLLCCVLVAAAGAGRWRHVGRPGRGLRGAGRHPHLVVAAGAGGGRTAAAAGGERGAGRGDAGRAGARAGQLPTVRRGGPPYSFAAEIAAPSAGQPARRAAPGRQAAGLPDASR